ncbi:MAG: 23S rRNA (adenine(2503)-C(2))-methyltransferase RlmN [Planctomycetes bacterium]|nr:23S rRNA (adenine(2503)-C(2))-methyltransferase RlmN [Planctomycetota bacterium]
MSARRRITDLSPAELSAFASAQHQRPFRGQQIYDWVMGRGVCTTSAMSDLSKPLREALDAEFDCSAPRVLWSGDSASGTEKAFLQLSDAQGDGVEAVLIMEGERTTACISSQAGCPVACVFCASGVLGLRRNLTRGEILDQFIAVRERAQALGRRVSNIVVMGMGEPMLNYSAVVEALDVIHDPKGGGIGARHITISTVGLEKGVRRLTEEGKPYTLAFSLHAPNDELRRKLVPFAAAMDIDAMVQAAGAYLDGTGREVTFEYVLLDGVNASAADAHELAQRLRGVRGTVNLIPYNENPGFTWKRPPAQQVDQFAEILRSGGVKVSVRKRKGHRILAACGQLRLQEMQRAQ